MTRKADLDAAIRAYCKANGIVPRPWEVHPADVDSGPSPWPADTAGARSWPQAQALRRQIIAAITKAKE